MNTTESLTIGQTVRLAPAFCNPKERDLRFTVTAIDGGSVSLSLQGREKRLTLAAQAVVPA